MRSFINLKIIHYPLAFSVLQHKDSNMRLHFQRVYPSTFLPWNVFNNRSRSDDSQVLSWFNNLPLSYYILSVKKNVTTYNNVKDWRSVRWKRTCSRVWQTCVATSSFVPKQSMAARHFLYLHLYFGVKHKITASTSSSHKCYTELNSHGSWDIYPIDVFQII